MWRAKIRGASITSITTTTTTTTRQRRDKQSPIDLSKVLVNRRTCNPCNRARGGGAKRKPPGREARGLSGKGPSGDLLSHGETPHYHRRYTVSLLSSGWDQVVPVLYGRQEKRRSPRRRRHDPISCDRKWRVALSPKALGCYMVKPHGQLVRVSSTRYRASTPRLSTSWSSTDLQGPQGSRETSSWEGLPA